MGNRPPTRAQLAHQEKQQLAQVLRKLGCSDATIVKIIKVHAIKSRAELSACTKQELLTIGMPLGAVNKMHKAGFLAQNQQYPGNPNHVAVPVASALPVARAIATPVAPLLGAVQPRQGWSPAKKKGMVLVLAAFVLVIIIISSASQ